MKFLIRNDDIAVDSGVNELKKFCEICDKHDFKIIQSITPIGFSGKRARANMSNERIRLLNFNRFEENKEVFEYLKVRRDFIGVHGLWHTHVPTIDEITTAKAILQAWGFNPTYFVPPFNEGGYAEEVEGLKTSQLSMDKGERLEDFLKEGEPKSPIMYLHSWRFNNRNYTFDQLEECLSRLSRKIKKLTDLEPDRIRIWYNDWVSKNAVGSVLDIGKSRHWDYGFPTLDMNRRLNPTYVGSIEKIDFPDDNFDTVLCNGMYEFVSDPQSMISEVLRITKKGGTAIFGFVGKNYKPYRDNWKFYEGKETLPQHTIVDFDQEYYFLICHK